MNIGYQNVNEDETADDNCCKWRENVEYLYCFQYGHPGRLMKPAQCSVEVASESDKEPAPLEKRGTVLVYHIRSLSATVNHVAVRSIILALVYACFCCP